MQLKNKDLKSPISGKKNIKLFDELDSEMIINKYNEELGLDVRHYFEGIPKTKIYKCLDTGFKFYFPFSLAGKTEFYEKLGKGQDYYRSWRSEHQYVYDKLKDGSDVLELGCGSGNFMAKLKEDKSCNCVGLEFNKEAIKIANARGLTVYNKPIQDYAKECEGKFDIVCSFQVMEHVVGIKEIIEASVQLLKKGGKLIIAVPNNNPYIYKYEKYNTLNLPPHHIGLWDKHSLSMLVNLFPLQIESIYVEPLESQQVKSYFNAFIGMISARLKALHILLLPFAYAYLVLLKLLTQSNLKLIDGRNVIAIYHKVKE